ncbi:MAG TPA: carboxypeptidase-like regulatory domain-containing protein [Longimicrobiales bacterium]|nr:carboxypeptidase-like regulatory domain-containing protein [Longimicrobiales bacterium]
MRGLPHAFGIASLALLLVRGPLAAQAPVVVDVRLLGEDGTAITNALVRALDAAGDTVTGQVTNADGRARIVVPRPGRYQFVVHHVRYQDWSSGLVDVDATTGMLEFRLPERAIAIEGIDALTDRRCDTPPEEGPAILRMYELMQVALGKVVEGERGRMFRVREMRERTGRPGTGRDTVYLRSRPAGTPAASFVTTYGWAEARIGYNDRTVYHVPAPDALTSERFRETHCFRTDEHADSGWGGLRFEPMRGSPLTPDRGDVRGTVWIDTISVQPIRVDFEYAALNRIVVRTDGPAVEQRLRVILKEMADGLERIGLYELASRYRRTPRALGGFTYLRDRDYGGHVVFGEIDGALVSARWEIRYPWMGPWVGRYGEGAGATRYRLTGEVLEVTGG